MLNQTRGCLKVIIKCPDLGQFYKHGSSAPHPHTLSLRGAVFNYPNQC